MSEKLRQLHEHNEHQLGNGQKLYDVAPERRTTSNETIKDRPVEKIRRTIEQQSQSSESIKKHQFDQGKADTHLYVPNSTVKKHSLDQTLRRMRRQLTRSERQFSKIIHNSAIEQISDAAAQTLARPSGLLAGGLFALISSLGLLIICYYYGYSYNFLAAIVFLGGGYVLGVAVELFARLVRN